MDLGAEMMEQVTPALSHSRWMAAAPALPPLPPTTYSMSMAHMSMRFTISLMSAPPLEVPCSKTPCLDVGSETKFESEGHS